MTGRCRACRSQHSRFYGPGDADPVPAKLRKLMLFFCNECLQEYARTEKSRPYLTVARHQENIRGLPGVKVRRAINILKGEIP